MKAKVSTPYEDMTPQEKEQLKERDRLAHMSWLKFIIAEKRALAVEYKDKKIASKIYLRSANVYEEELNLLVGRTPIPDSHSEMSEKMASLYEILYSKQSLLIIGKGGKSQAKYEQDVRLAEIEIEKQEKIEGINKELVDVPF